MESSDSENDEAPTSPVQSTPRQPVAINPRKEETGKPRFVGQLRWLICSSTA